MKQKILEALKTKFDGVDEKVLSRIAEKLAKTATTEEQVQPTVDGVTFQQIIDGEADRRVTEATQTAVINYEKKHGLKDGQKTQTGGVTVSDDLDKKGKGNSDDVPEWAKALIDSNKAFSEKLSGLEKEKLSETRKQKLDVVVSKLPENLRKPYNRIDLQAMNAEDFDTFITETTQEVEEITNDNTAKGSVFSPPRGGGNPTGDPSKEDVATVVSSMLP